MSIENLDPFEEFEEQRKAIRERGMTELNAFAFWRYRLDQQAEQRLRAEIACKRAEAVIRHEIISDARDRALKVAGWHRGEHADFRAKVQLDKG